MFDVAWRAPPPHYMEPFVCLIEGGGVSTTPSSDLWVSWVESIKCTFHRFVLRSCSEHLSYVVTNLAQTWRFPPGPVGRSTVNWSRVNWSNALQTREMGMPQCRWLEGWMKSTVAAVCRKQQGGFNGERKRRKRKVLREGKAKRQRGKQTKTTGW